MDEISQELLEFGCVLFGGYVRDVVIRGQKSINDFDIAIEERRIDEFVNFLTEKFEYKQTALLRGESDMYKIKGIKGTLQCSLNNIRCDIYFFENIDDHIIYEPGFATFDLFYMTKFGVFCKRIPEGESLCSILKDIRSKQLKIYYLPTETKTLNFILKKINDFIRKGWQLSYAQNQMSM